MLKFKDSHIVTKRSESVLKTELHDASRTQVDIPKDALGLGEQEEEIPQQEINISTTNYQVSTKVAPDSSNLASTLPPNEKQLEVELFRHMEEVQEPNLEHVYSVGSLRNMLTWGEKQIPEPMDEVANIQDISYD
jgi:cytoskeletal protein RodZ